MSDKRRQTKARKEIEETKILVDYLMHQGYDVEELGLEYFTDPMVKLAVEWNNNRS